MVFVLVSSSVTPENVSLINWLYVQVVWYMRESPSAKIVLQWQKEWSGR